MENPKENTLEIGALAGEISEGACDASSLPIRLLRYSEAHSRAVLMSHYAKSQGDVNLSGKLDRCGSYLLFRDYYTINTVKLHAADFCKKHLLCPLCAIRRGAKMVKAYLQRLAVVAAENPNLKPYLVTLTVKDGDDLGERFNHLHRSIQRLHKMRHADIGREKGEASKASGAVWSYEFKRGKNSGCWHPHVHAVWLCATPPDQSALSAEWRHITGDSFIVDVRPFHNDADVLGGFLEVFKYAVKFSDLPLADNWHGFKILSGKRLIASFGVLRGVQIPDSYLDDPLPDDLPFLEMMFKYSNGVGYSNDPSFCSLSAARFFNR